MKRSPYAQHMRASLTPEERRLWRLLRDRRFNGVKFRRQHPVGPYIVDFACFSARLVIELDGGQHDLSRAYDERRTAYLKRQGWCVIRFWNNELRDNEEGVLLVIAAALATPSPRPSP